MTILWAGGEDTDFPTNTFPLNASAGNFRSGYARTAIQASTGSAGVYAKGVPFSGGAVTSAWITGRVSSTAFSSGRPLFGLGLSGTDKALLVGIGSAANKVGIYRIDGATATAIATETSSSLQNSQINRIDMQVINYGASATVNVYVAGVLALTFTGNVATTGMTNFDSVFLGNPTAGTYYYSEFIVADEDTRTMNLVTLAPNAAGDANAWTGTYADVDETTISDADALYTDTVGQDAQIALSNLPAGYWACKAVKLAARCSKSSGAVAGSVGLGIKSGGTINSETPAAQATAWATRERLLLVNPVTGVAFTQTELDALQLNFRSAA